MALLQVYVFDLLTLKEAAVRISPEAAASLIALQGPFANKTRLKVCFDCEQQLEIIELVLGPIQHIVHLIDLKRLESIIDERRPASGVASHRRDQSSSLLPVEAGAAAATVRAFGSAKGLSALSNRLLGKPLYAPSVPLKLKDAKKRPIDREHIHRAATRAYCIMRCWMHVMKRIKPAHRALISESVAFSRGHEVQRHDDDNDEVHSTEPRDVISIIECLPPPPPSPSPPSTADEFV